MAFDCTTKKHFQNCTNLLALSANCTCVQNFRPSAYFNRRLQHSWKLHTSIWPFPSRDLQVSIQWDDKEHSGIRTDKVRYLSYKVQHSQVAWIFFDSRWQIKNSYFPRKKILFPYPEHVVSFRQKSIMQIKRTVPGTHGPNTADEENASGNTRESLWITFIFSYLADRQCSWPISEENKAHLDCIIMELAL